MKVFLDTNVVVDYLAKRESFFEHAAFIFEMIRQNIIEGIVSSLTLVNCACVMRKYYDKSVVLRKLTNVMNMLEVSEIDFMVIKEAIELHAPDFEGAVQFASAKNYSPDIILTRDKTGFTEFDLPVMAPSEFVEACR